MKKTICLNMIVKNEKEVITRCLKSIKHLIDYWVIVDTGSTDGTQNIIREFLKEIPGELHERPWVDFGYNRNEALTLTKGKADYALFIDADDILVFSEDFVLPELDADAYCIVQRESYLSTFREHSIYFLIRTDLDFCWKGVLHEAVFFNIPKSIYYLGGVYNKYINDGSRAKDPKKIQKDIKLLKKGIQDEPNNTRYHFYLARTYWSIRDYRSALKYFEKRVKMGGDYLEVYHSLLFIPICQQYLNFPAEVFIKNFCQAHLFRPSRAESMYELARYFADKKCYLMGYYCAKLALAIPPSKDTLFVESWVYDWGAMLYTFVCASNLGYLTEAGELLTQLLNKTTFPQEIRKDFELDKWHQAIAANNDLQNGNCMVS